ncbi:MAG: hypothetical protein WA709_12825 [Stellaceae bacterium]
MSFETTSLLLNWMEMGALLAILFRLSSTFELIASTQRELRRAIHREHRAAELHIANSVDGPGVPCAFRSRQAPGYTEGTGRPDDLARPSP